MRTLLKRLVKKVISPIEHYRGRFSDIERHRNVIRNAPTIPMALEDIEDRWPVALRSEGDRPVFILSAGWRSGSTLLQRLLLSSREVFVWGEPYAHCDYIRFMANTLTSIQQNVPPDSFFVDHYEKERKIRLEETWVACLYPSPTTLLEAHKQFFRALFAEPAYERGFKRWGIKEVRLGIEHAIYLKKLFPDALFLFLYRNPYDAYRSYRTFNGWYDRWPDKPVFTPTAFGRHWKRLLEGFLGGVKDVGGKLICYENLVERKLDLAELSEYLGTEVSADVLDQKVTGRGIKEVSPISKLEKGLLRKAVDPLAHELGYNAD